MSEHFYTTMKSPIGEIVLTSFGKGISGLYIEGHKFHKQAKEGIENAKPFKEAVKQLNEYFAGRRIIFDLPLDPKGTDFQKKVWGMLTKITYGKTKSYGEVAVAIKKPLASRAVGMANNKNPISIIVPCHRVIGANGKLTGYASGLNDKEWLLAHEGKIKIAK